MIHFARICLGVFAAGLAVSCMKDSVDGPQSGNRLPGPKAVVSDLACDSFKVSWDAVTDAWSYTYVFNGGDTLTTRNTSVVFSGLEPDSEYELSIRSDAGINGNRRNSNFVNLRVVTGDVTVLDTPEPVLVAAYMSKTIFSWSPVSGASSYRYSVGGYSGTVTKCTVELSGFEASTDYVFELTAVSDDKYVNDSNTAKLNFTTRPSSEDIPQIIFSHVETGADYSKFNVYALPDFHYLYFCWPETYLTGMTDTEIRDLYLELWLQSLEDSKVDVAVGVSEYAYAGTASYVADKLCPELTYRVGVFGVDKSGKAVTPLYGCTTKTIAENSSPVPDIAGANWFMQALMLPTGTGTSNPTNCVGLFWIGRDIVSVRSLMTSTRSYRNYFDASPELFMEYVREEGTVTDDREALSEINSDKGFTAVYQGLESATSYTVGTLAVNADNETAFFVNSLPTRSSTDYTVWATVSLGRSAKYPTESSLEASLDFSFDPKSEPFNFHVAGVRYLFCKYSELEGFTGDNADKFVREKGVDLQQSDIVMMNMEGSLSLMFGIDGTPLEPRTRYILMATFTERNGDRTTSYATASTAVPATSAVSAVKSAAGNAACGRPAARVVYNAPAMLDIYEPVKVKDNK